MDSANSGSLQSSSGGDEEYDSRSESISAFFNSSSSTTTTTTITPPPPTTTHPPHHFFSPLPFFDNPNPNALLSLDTPWSPALLSSFSTTLPANPPPADHSTPPPDPSPIPAAAPRNSKKRSRASRRAPTTVLTTDTTNFRAMVQEFTGIPTAPFAASFPRSRFDAPPYLLRPFALKPQTPPSSSATTNVSYESLLNMPPQMNTFQNLLQSQLNPKFSIPTMSGFRPQAPTQNPDYTGVVDIGLPSNRRDNLTGWGQAEGSEDRTQPPARQSEGIMESWMCSSD